MIVLGSWWASIAWSRYWGWDPKETAALVTWLTYAVYLHARNQRRWAGRPAALLLVVGFGMVLVTYSGSLWFTGLHAYSRAVGGPSRLSPLPRVPQPSVARLCAGTGARVRLPVPRTRHAEYLGLMESGTRRVSAMRPVPHSPCECLTARRGPGPARRGRGRRGACPGVGLRVHARLSPTRRAISSAGRPPPQSSRGRSARCLENPLAAESTSEPGISQHVTIERGMLEASTSGASPSDRRRLGPEASTGRRRPRPPARGPPLGHARGSGAGVRGTARLGVAPRGQLRDLRRTRDHRHPGLARPDAKPACDRDQDGACRPPGDTRHARPEGTAGAGPSHASGAGTPRP